MPDRSLKEIQERDERWMLMRLAEAQQGFIERYIRHIPAESQHYFARDVMFLLQLTYREATQPLTKQIVDVLNMQSRPIVFEKAPHA